MFSRNLLFGAAAGALLALPIAGLSADKVIKYAHFQTAELSSPKHAAALAFKGCVEANTGGSVEVQIFPASQLGGGPEVLEGLQLGTIQMGVVHDGPISAVYQPFMVFALPYLFDDQAEAWTVVDGPFGQAFAEAMTKESGIRLLAMADNGIRNFTNNKRPISSPADMEGLKIRVMTGPVWIRLVESLGASATPVAWPELPGALQQGVVDGQENGVTNILNASLYQHQKHVSLDGHVYSWHAYMINDQFFNSLAENEQKAVSRCVEIAKVIHRGMTAAQDANAPSILGEKGMTVTPLSGEQKAAFREKAQPAVRAWIVEQIGAQWPDKLDEAIAQYRASH